MSNLTQRPIFQKGAKPVKSAAAPIRKSARGETCTLRLPCCQGGTETVILAHLRVFARQGMGQKPKDRCAVYSCASCHDAIDRRNSMTSGLWGFEDLLRALLETHDRLEEKGLLISK